MLRKGIQCLFLLFVSCLPLLSDDGAAFTPNEYELASAATNYVELDADGGSYTANSFEVVDPNNGNIITSGTPQQLSPSSFVCTITLPPWTSDEGNASRTIYLMNNGTIIGHAYIVVSPDSGGD